MDDIYFSDKKKKNDELNIYAGRDKFTGTDYYDESFNLNFKKRGNAQVFSDNRKNFQLNIPESELEMQGELQDVDRTPKGRAVSHIGNNANINNGYPYSTRPVSEQDYSSYGNSYYAAQQRQDPHRQNPPRQNPYAQNYYSQAPRNDGYRRQNSAEAPPQNRNPRGPRVGMPQPQQRQNPSAQPPRGMQTNPQPDKNGNDSKKVKNKAKGSPVRKIIAGFMCLLIILISALGVFAYSAIDSLTYDETIVPNQYISESELYSSPSVTNILLIGSDARGDVDGQRSDTMILFSIDKKNGQIKLTSFLRDSYVYIPSKGYKTKLNAAFSYGGTQLVMDTIEYNFGVNIDNYVMVSFDAFQQIVDLMGGVTIEGVTAKEAQYMNDVVDIKSVKEGTNKMNGFTALWYCRIRKLDSDFYRTQRQRKVISAVISQAKKTNPITLANICKKVLPYISTDINKSELTTLAVGAVLSFLRYDMAQQQIPADGTWSSQRINGSDVIAMDIEQNKNILKTFLEEKYVEPVQEEE